MRRNAIAVLSIRGRKHEWLVTATMSREQIVAMRDDGIEIGEAEYAVPAWIVDVGLAGAWCFALDLIRLRKPWFMR